MTAQSEQHETDLREKIKSLEDINADLESEVKDLTKEKISLKESGLKIKRYYNALKQKLEEMKTENFQL